MPRPQQPPSYFPELSGEEQRQADAWLHDYIRLVLRIWREDREKKQRELSTDSA